eukprot:3048359-Pyramimonas_sp.AAC.1
MRNDMTPPMDGSDALARTLTIPVPAHGSCPSGDFSIVLSHCHPSISFANNAMWWTSAYLSQRPLTILDTIYHSPHTC